MAKASLTKVTKEWIDGKKQKNKKIKNEKNKLSGKKSLRTLHFADEAYRLLMYHKADTGESMSATIERLVLKNLKKT